MSTAINGVYDNAIYVSVPVESRLSCTDLLAPATYPSSVICVTDPKLSIKNSSE